MPASSRKRNKGKDRKAKKEEIEKARMRNLWWGWTVNDCDHGRTLISNDHPVSNFMDQYYINAQNKGMTVSQNLGNLSQTHTQIYNNESYRKLVLDILVHIGTNFLLNQGRYDIANALCIAQSIVALEHYDGSNVINFVINKRVVASKWRDLSINSSNRRDILKFYRKRTSCSCLKKMHLEARKTFPKLGICHGCQKECGRSALAFCSRCMIYQFCSRECQVANWPRHKMDCDLYVRATCEQIDRTESLHNGYP